MRTHVVEQITIGSSVEDTTWCDSCNTILDMNVKIKDRNVRYKPSQVRSLGRYFSVTEYTGDGGDTNYYCRDCMLKLIHHAAMDSSPFVESLEVSTHAGVVIDEELKAIEQAKKLAAKEKRESAQAAMAAQFQQTLDEENARFDRLMVQEEKPDDGSDQVMKSPIV